jgi:hypothetical protein
MASKVIVFHEALVRQKNAFHQLLYVQCMPKAYKASLEEVIRRKKYAKKISSMVNKIPELLAKFREEEIKQRQM